MIFSADSKCVGEVRAAVNFGERRAPFQPDILLLHYTGMDSDDGALKWLCSAESGVSCHYYVRTNGSVLQLVPEVKRAHHAGVGSWEGHDDINSRSIGIEIVNAGHPGGLPDFPPAQMQAVAELSRDIILRHKIEPHHVLAHSDIAPGRKEDPGEKFDWGWLADQGVGLHVVPSSLRPGPFLQRGDTGQSVEAWQSLLVLYGYGLEISGEFDEKTHVVTEAFQRHFRQEKVDGVADYSTIDTLHRLLGAKLGELV